MKGYCYFSNDPDALKDIEDAAKIAEKRKKEGIGKGACSCLVDGDASCCVHGNGSGWQDDKRVDKA